MPVFLQKFSNKTVVVGKKKSFEMTIYKYSVWKAWLLTS